MISKIINILRLICYVLYVGCISLFIIICVVKPFILTKTISWIFFQRPGLEMLMFSLASIIISIFVSAKIARAQERSSIINLLPQEQQILINDQKLKFRDLQKEHDILDLKNVQMQKEIEKLRYIVRQAQASLNPALTIDNGDRD